MSNPNIDNIQPNIDIDREQVINLLLASVALDELAIAHLVNGEAEKLQRALGTLEVDGDTPPALIETLDDWRSVNRDVIKFLKFATQKEFNLLVKLQDVVDFAEEFTPPEPEPAVCPCEILVNASGTTTFQGQQAVVNLNAAICPGCTPEGTLITITATLGGANVPITVFTPSIDVVTCGEDFATVTFVGVATLPGQAPAQAEFTLFVQNGTIVLSAELGGTTAAIQLTGTATVTPCPLPEG
ncbi:hypothetical protein [Halalkalibacter krulwichiae]|uniref:Uncharacterized protein n=1 Tax=Halalkalibacter krulwichiae TaxID=199441 RepID=A0A1X9MGX3_9BACI|nr:hypothetical protein [Halalkalibacter krulwichiae]ARK32715.1 hypothetical protein BkAM31D_24235 [Halalkalibacter krulwichiae]